MPESIKGAKLIRVLAVLVLSWAMITLWDIPDRSESGFETNGNHTVIHVTRGSPAEAAGLRVQDYIMAINGIANHDVAGLARLGRAKIGETRRLTIRRGDELLELEVMPGPLSRISQVIAWLSTFTGLVFLVACVLVFLQHPARATRVLAMMGIGFSLVFLDGTRFDSLFLQSVIALIRSGLVLAAFAGMLHFLLVFPAPGSFASQQRNIRVLYLPAFLFWLLLAYRAFFRADASSSLNTLTYLLTGLIIAGYCLFSLIVFLRKYLKTPGPQRTEQGLRLMLVGSLLGFGPAMLGYMPALSGVPGQEVFFISLVLVPITWSRAARCVYGPAGKSP